jgi:hypothetical protein
MRVSKKSHEYFQKIDFGLIILQQKTNKIETPKFRKMVISNSGSAKIYFNKDLVIPNLINNINSTTLEVNLL